MNWEKNKFGSLYKIASRNGLTKPSKVRGEGYKMINMGELFSYDRIYDVPMELVPLKDSEKINAKVEVGDLLFARQSLVLEGAGKCSIVMETSDLTVFESHIIRVRLKSGENPLFYYYYFKSPLSPISTIVSQCAQAGIRGNDLSNLEVICPPRGIQDKIVDILSAYDDLIENNQKQIKLLEEAAQHLYKEWFIDLRFPGHENVEIVDGIPVGWEYLEFLNIAPIITGKKDANFSSKNGKYLFFTCSQQPLLAESYSYDCDAVILAGNGDFNVKLYRGKFEAYQRTYVLSPYKTEHLYLLFYTIKNRMNYLIQGASGSTIKFLTKWMIADIKVLVPTCEILNQYNEIAEPLQRKLEVLIYQIKLLTEARDRLLPKLMSGEIEV